MIVLYCNPSFWEYRLPFYVELNKLFNGNFHVLYSTRRYQNGHERLLDKIINELGENAHPYDNELMFDVKSKSFKHFTEGGKQIPIPTSLWKKISSIRPDIIITEGFFQWTPLVQIWGFLHKVPVFMGYERTMHTERNNSKVKTFIRKIQNLLIKGYIVNGLETKKYLESIGVTSNKIFIGGMCADSKGLRSSISSFPIDEKIKFKLNYKIRDEGLIYLYSGRIEHLKGTPYLLSAWIEHIKKYTNDSIILIGNGDLFKELKTKYESERSIFLEGRKPYEEVYKYYAIADVFILPTLQDNWSLVIPEAMSCGLPVATSIYNGCYPELVKEGENGYVFDTFNHNSIVKALDYFHNVDLKSFSKNSIELEKNYSTENCAQRTYKAIVDSVKL